MNRHKNTLLAAMVTLGIISISCDAPKRLKCNNKRYCNFYLKKEKYMKFHPKTAIVKVDEKTKKGA